MMKVYQLCLICKEIRVPIPEQYCDDCRKSVEDIAEISKIIRCKQQQKEEEGAEG